MNDLIVISLKDRIEAMTLVNEKRVCLAVNGDDNSLKVGMLQGPDFGKKFQQSKVINIKGHTVQRIEVVEEFNLVIAACFNEED